MKILFREEKGAVIIIDTEKCQTVINKMRETDVVVAKTSVGKGLLKCTHATYEFSSATLTLFLREGELLVEVREWWTLKFSSSSFSLKEVWKIEGEERIDSPQQIKYTSGDESICVTTDKETNWVSIEEGYRLAILFPEVDFHLHYHFDSDDEVVDWEEDSESKVDYLTFLSNLPKIMETPYLPEAPAWVNQVAYLWAIGA